MQRDSLKKQQELGNQIKLKVTLGGNTTGFQPCEVPSASVLGVQTLLALQARQGAGLKVCDQSKWAPGMYFSDAADARLPGLGCELTPLTSSWGLCGLLLRAGAVEHFKRGNATFTPRFTLPTTWLSVFKQRQTAPSQTKALGALPCGSLTCQAVLWALLLLVSRISPLPAATH